MKRSPLPVFSTASLWPRLGLLVLAPALLGSLGDRSSFDERILAAHNRERLALGLDPLQWDERLAEDASLWAEELAQTGQFEHSPDEDTDEDAYQGENLWAGTVGHFQPEAMVGLWAAEKKHFRDGVFPDNSRTGDVDDVSHYTQLVWHDTLAVGCALREGDSEDVLVCRYSRAGNVIGEELIPS